jgi:transposase-like protein
LVKRGLVGVQLAISDAHAGLKTAIAKVLGCAWQRCTVHFLRDCFGHARKDQHGLLGALIRPIFNSDSLAQARDRLSEAVAHLDGRLSKIASMLEDAEEEILAFYAFPASHWRKLRSTNPLERFNKEVGRRTDVVGIFPDDRSLIRLAGMLCIEQNDCHEGRQDVGAVCPPRAEHSALFRATASTRGGWRAVSRDRLGHPPRGLVFPHEGW